MITVQDDHAARVVKCARMAIGIADEDSAVTIECNCGAVRDKIGRVLWYDLSSADVCGAWAVNRAAEYLLLRGKLRRSRKNTQHVKPTAVRA